MEVSLDYFPTHVIDMLKTFWVQEDFLDHSKFTHSDGYTYLMSPMGDLVEMNPDLQAATFEAKLEKFPSLWINQIKSKVDPTGIPQTI